MRCALFASILLGLVGSSVAAQDRKGIQFWNLTLYTITSFQMSPAAKDSWGSDQCKNDRDGTVDHDERLRITGIEPGRYDVGSAVEAGRFHCWDQAASFPDALATWVAIASIKAGDRQS
jgi:hypothetical protein